VHELADLAALGADDPVRVADVGEPKRQLGVGVAARREPGDRDRHVGSQREQLAALVEEPVGADPAPPLGLLEDVVVLESRRRDLAVAALLEDLGQGRLERAELAHLVREDVPGSRWNRVNHPSMMAWGAFTGCKLGRERG
jgi:hypothetical protein